MTHTCLLGAIAGDMIGSVYEYDGFKDMEFPLLAHRSRFTDDTVLTLAVADAILSRCSYQEKVYDYARYYHGRGYGGRFRAWKNSDDPQPYNSFGNGSAMRVSAGHIHLKLFLLLFF